MTESLAARLGLDLTALVFPNRPSTVNVYGDERTFPITIKHSFLQTTCKVDHSPDDEGLLQVLEELQKRVDLENSMREDDKQSALLERKPYWLVVGPGSEQLVFATASQAKELRACGYLREGRHRRRLIEAIEQQIAKFAGVGALCPGLAIASDDRYSYTLEVSLGESVSTIVLANKKYPDVTPILDYLNSALEVCERPRRLHVYRTPGTGDGVLLASETEARELAHLRYIEGIELAD